MVLTFKQSQPAHSSIFPQDDPTDVIRLARQAAQLAGSGDTTGAMRCYQLALLMDETRAEIWLNYGILQERVGQFGDALESFDYALRLDPDMYMARYRMARVCYHMGRPLEALSQFRAVARQRPAYIPAWRNLVELTWALGHHDEAQKVAAEALSHAPDAEIEAMVERIRADRTESA